MWLLLLCDKVAKLCLAHKAKKLSKTLGVNPDFFSKVGGTVFEPLLAKWHITR